MEATHIEPVRSTSAPNMIVVEAALNDIRAEIASGLVKISATLNKAGIAKLRRKLDALEILIEDEENEAAE